MLEKCTELLLAVPEGFTEAFYLECIAAQGGLGVPLNIFLMQVPYVYMCADTYALRGLVSDQLRYFLR